MSIYEEEKLTVSSFKLSLNKKTLMIHIYFNPLAERLLNTVNHTVALGWGEDNLWDVKANQEWQFEG